MPVVACPSCAAKLRAPDDTAGRSIKCPKCGTSIRVPGAGGRRTAPEDDEPDRPLDLPPEEVADADDAEEAEDDPSASRRRGRDDEDDDEDDDRPRPRKKPAWRDDLSLTIIAALLIVYGVGSVFVGASMPTTARASGVGDVHNIGLIHERQTAIFGGLACVALGILVKGLAVLKAIKKILSDKGS